MANQIATSNTVVMYDEVIQGADIACSISKALPLYKKDEEEWQRSGGTIWIPEEFSVEASTGIDSTGSEVGLIDRMCPLHLEKAYHIKLPIGVKQLSDGRLSDQGKKSLIKALKNIVDLTCYTEIMNRATMVVHSATQFDYDDASHAESLMTEAGLSGYGQKLILSTPHHRVLASELAKSSFKDKTNLTAFEKLSLPDVAGFDTMKADYSKQLVGRSTTGLTVNGNQSHTVATYTDANENTFLDNRSMELNVTGATAANAKDGDKIQIANVYGLHPSTYESTGELRTFSINKGESGKITISPAIIITGADRNCDVQAANGAAITFLNTTDSSPSVFFAEDSVYLVPGRLPVANEAAGSVNAVEMVLDNGVPVRFTSWWNAETEVLNIKALLYFDVAVVCPSRVGVILTDQA